MVWNKTSEKQKKRKQTRNQRHRLKKQKQLSTLHANSATVPNATPLSVPSNEPNEHDYSSLINNNSPIVVNGIEIPSVCADINRKDTLEKALDFLTRTKIEEDSPVPNGPSNLSPGSAEKHKACVCVICDSFIIGTEQIVWLSKTAIKNKSSYLSTSFYQTNIRKGSPLPTVLRNQYLIEDDDDLKDLLLSPRAHK